MANNKNIKKGSPEDSYYSYEGYDKDKASWERKREQEKSKKIVEVEKKKPDNNGDVYINDTIENISIVVDKVSSKCYDYTKEIKKVLDRDDVEGLIPESLNEKFLEKAGELLSSWYESIEEYFDTGFGITKSEDKKKIEVNFVLRENYEETIKAEWMPEPKTVKEEYHFEFLSARVPKNKEDVKDYSKWVTLSKTELDEVVRQNGKDVDSLNKMITDSTKSYTVRWLIHYYSSLKRNVVGLESGVYKPKPIDWKLFASVYYRPVVQIQYKQKKLVSSKDTKKTKEEKEASDKEIGDTENKKEKYEKEKKTYSIDVTKKDLLNLLDKLDTIEDFFNKFMNVVDYSELIKSANECFGTYIDVDSELKTKLDESLGDMQYDMGSIESSNQNVQDLRTAYENQKDLPSLKPEVRAKIPTMSFSDNMKVFDPSGGMMGTLEDSLKEIIKTTLISKVKSVLNGSGLTCDDLKNLIDGNTLDKFKSALGGILDRIRSTPIDILSSALDGALNYLRSFISPDYCISPRAIVNSLGVISDEFTPNDIISVLSGKASDSTLSMLRDIVNRESFFDSSCVYYQNDNFPIEYVFSAIGSSDDWFGEDVLDTLQNIVDDGSDQNYRLGAKIRCTNAYDRLKEWLSRNGYEEDYIDCIVDTDKRKKEAAKNNLDELTSGDYADELSQNAILNKNLIDNPSYIKVLKELFDSNFKSVFMQYKNSLSYWPDLLSDKDTSGDSAIDVTSGIPMDNLPSNIDSDTIMGKYYDSMEYDTPPETTTAEEKNNGSILRAIRSGSDGVSGNLRFDSNDFIFSILDNAYSYEFRTYEGDKEQNNRYERKNIKMIITDDKYKSFIRKNLVELSEFGFSVIEGSRELDRSYLDDYMSNSVSAGRDMFSDSLYDSLLSTVIESNITNGDSIKEYFRTTLYDKIMSGVVMDGLQEFDITRNILRKAYSVGTDANGNNITADGIYLFSELLRAIDSVDCVSDKCNIFNSSYMMRDTLDVFKGWLENNYDVEDLEYKFVRLSNLVVNIRLLLLDGIMSNLYTVGKYNDVTDDVLINRVMSAGKYTPDDESLEVAFSSIFGAQDTYVTNEEKFRMLLEYDYKRLAKHINVLLIKEKQRPSSYLIDNLPILNVVNFTNDINTIQNISNLSTLPVIKSSNRNWFRTDQESLFLRAWYADEYGVKRFISGEDIEENNKRTFRFVNSSQSYASKSLREVYDESVIVHFDLCYGVFDSQAGSPKTVNHNNFKVVLTVKEDFHSGVLKDETLDCNIIGSQMFDTNTIIGTLGLFISSCVKETTRYDDLFADVFYSIEDVNRVTESSSLDGSFEDLVEFDFETDMGKANSDSDTFGLLKSFFASNSVEKMAAKMAMETAKLIFKGVVEQTDPNIKAARLLVDTAKMANKDIPISLASLGMLFPVNIAPPFGLGPPITPSGFAYLGLETMYEAKRKASEKLEDAVKIYKQGEAYSTGTSDGAENTMSEIEMFDFGRICRDLTELEIGSDDAAEESEEDQGERECQLPQISI